MSFEPGGRADKLGNRYEGRVIVDYMLRLLMEKIYSIEIESIGDEEEGIDFWVTELDHNKKAYQCKARNAAESYWNAGDLNARKVFKKAKTQLDNNHAFEFVSAIPTPILNDITIKARNSNDYKKFIDYQIKNTEETNQLKTFMRGLSFDENNEDHKEITYKYLKKIFFTTYPDDYDTKNRLLNTISLLLTGDCKKIYPLLKDFTVEEDYLGKTITSDTLWNFLKRHNFHPRNILRDERIIPKIQKQNNTYKQSILNQGLIHETLYERIEKKVIFESFNSKKIIFIHGKSGAGKSILLYDIYNDLVKNSNLCFAIRLDRIEFTGNTTDTFGELFGLPTSPAYCLNKFSQDRLSVLLIDQLDAVRTNSNSGGVLLDITKKMVEEVLYSSESDDNNCIIITCRTFDFENDPLIRNWLKEYNDILLEINLNEFDDSFVKEILGTKYNILTKKQQVLLRNPQNLKLWEIISKNGDDISKIDTTRKIIHQLLIIFKRNIDKIDAFTLNDFRTLNNEIIQYIEKTGRLYIPSRIIDNHSPSLRDFCISNGLLQHGNNDTYSYTHQSFLDFFIIKNLIEKIISGESLLS